MQSMGIVSDKSRIKADLDLAATLGGDNPKNYQIWYHRRALLEEHGIRDFLDSELSYIAEVLDEDSKNYHAWSHRQWIIQTADDEQVWLKELDFGTCTCVIFLGAHLVCLFCLFVCSRILIAFVICVFLSLMLAEKLIQEDPRNNSAWNQRWFAVHRAKRDPLSLEVARTEADFAIEKGATIDPYNESPWRYLVGLLKEQKKQISSQGGDSQPLLDEYEKKTFGLRDVLVKEKRNPDSCSNLSAARIDILEMMGGAADLETALSLAEGLANEHDPIRKKYWMLRKNTMQQKVEKLSS